MFTAVLMMMACILIDPGSRVLTLDQARFLAKNNRPLLQLSQCNGGIVWDELSDQGYTSLPKSDKIESGKMVINK